MEGEASDERHAVVAKGTVPPPPFCSLLYSWQLVIRAACPVQHICDQLIMDISPLATVRAVTFLFASLWALMMMMMLCYGD